MRDFVPDTSGSTVCMLNDSNIITDTWSYWPYGEEKVRTGVTPTPFQFVGTVGAFTALGLLLLNPFYSPKYVMILNQDGQQGNKRKPRLPKRWEFEGESQPGSFLHELAKLVGIRYVDALKYQYGHYCGASHVKNPGWNIVPQDCIDRACRVHDRCIEGHRGAGYSTLCSHACCDCILFWLASDCIDKGLWRELPKKSQQDEFKEAADVIVKGFGKLCTATKLIDAGLSIAFGMKCPKCLPDNVHDRYAEKHWGNDTCPKPRGIGS